MSNGTNTDDARNSQQTNAAVGADGDDGRSVVICGSRGFLDGSLFSDEDRVEAVARAVAKTGWKITTVISGTARGADTAGEVWAESAGIQVERYPADWDTHGKKAGMLRNTTMVEEADAVLALWNGSSRGTADTIRKARDMLGEDNVYVHRYDQEGSRDDDDGGEDEETRSDATDADVAKAVAEFEADDPRTLDEVGHRRAKFLADADIVTVADVARTPVDDLEDVRWFGPVTAPRIRARARDAVDEAEYSNEALRAQNTTRLLLVGANEKTESGDPKVELSFEQMDDLVTTALTRSEKLSARGATDWSCVEVGYLANDRFGDQVSSWLDSKLLETDVAPKARRALDLSWEQKERYLRALSDDYDAPRLSDVDHIPFLEAGDDIRQAEWWMMYAEQRQQAVEWADEVVILVDGEYTDSYRRLAENMGVRHQTVLASKDDGTLTRYVHTEQQTLEAYTPADEETVTSTDIGPSMKPSDDGDDDDDDWANCVRNPWKHDKYESSAHDDGPRAGSVADMESEEWHDGPFDTDEDRRDPDEPEVGGGVGSATWGQTR